MTEEEYRERLGMLRLRASRRPQETKKYESPLDVPADPSLSYLTKPVGPRRIQYDTTGEVGPYTPTPRERMAAELQDRLERQGVGRSTAIKRAETSMGGQGSNLPLGVGIADFVPFLGYALQADEAVRGAEQALRDLNRGDYLGAGIEGAAAVLGVVPGAAASLKSARQLARGAERMANVAVPTVARRFTDVPLFVEAVSPNLGQKGSRAFREGITEELIGPGGAYDLGTMSGRQTTQTPGQGIYRNVAKQLETNPMRAVYVPGISNISKSPQLLEDVASAGSALEQEAMAGIRFLPMATNRLEDASAMLIKPKKGELSPEDIVALSERLGDDMVVAHNPRLGGVVVVPFGEVRLGEVPSEFLKAQSAADEVLGRSAKVQYGVADMARDRLFMMKPEYAGYGARPASPEFEKYRDEMKYLEGRLFGSGPEGGIQSWSRGPAYPTTVMGRGEGWQPVNLATEEYGRVFPTFRQADEARDVMLQDWQRTLPGKVRGKMRSN